MHRGSIKRGGINIKELHSSAETILKKLMYCRDSAKSSQKSLFLFLATNFNLFVYK